MSTQEAKSKAAKWLLNQFRMLRSGTDTETAAASIELEQEMGPALKKHILPEKHHANRPPLMAPRRAPAGGKSKQHA